MLYNFPFEINLDHPYHIEKMFILLQFSIPDFSFKLFICLFGLISQFSSRYHTKFKLQTPRVSVV